MKICKNCGMIRSSKDMVLLQDGGYLCFACWNKYCKEKEIQTNP
ncbi:MAG: hypothetical protein ACTSRI_19110 [Promethearchaeota archaeon]